MFLTFPAITQNPHAFLRVNILSFHVNHNHPINLTDVKTQIELKEKHGSTLSNVESKTECKRCVLCKEISNFLFKNQHE